MFVRQKKNKSGVVSVQVIDKSSGKYKVIKTLGSSSSISRVEMLVKEGEHWIKSQLGQAEIDLSAHRMPSISSFRISSRLPLPERSYCLEKFSMR
ncbi:hypothetical protein [Pedobacter jamesrossensis]|uniref:hypothetical protein n=1 Tax=Pedobacter jamesrossensis TaxID=1908238 RepID=UPI00361D1837